MSTTAYDKLQQSVSAWSQTIEDSNESMPGTSKEVSETLSALKELAAASPTAEEQAYASQVQSVLDQVTKKKFTGSWLMLAVVGIFWLFILKSDIGDIGYSLSLDQAKSTIQERVGYFEREVSRLQEQPAEMKERQNLLPIFQESLAEWQQHSKDPEAYRSSRVWSVRRSGISGVIRCLFFLGFVGLYYWTARIPQYVINRRKRETAVAAASRTIIKSIIIGVISLPLSFEAFSTVYTLWSDGRKTKDFEINPIFIAALLFCVIILGLILIVMLYAVPIIALVNLVRNRLYLLAESQLAKVAFLDRIQLLNKLA